MFHFTLAVLTLSLFFSTKTYGIDQTIFDEALYAQAVDYNPSLADKFYCWKIPNESFLEFLKLYKNRPLQENKFGMRSHGNFFLWYLLKGIDPALVIESGVLRGQSTWTIEHGAPKAKIIAIDPEPHHRVYKSKKASYTPLDFSLLDINTDRINGPIACFFDDHINAFDRVMQAYKKGFKYLIFDDNYGACSQSEIYHLTLSNCFEMEEFKEKGEMLSKIIKHYYIMPQIIGKTSNHPVCERIATNLPAIWTSLEEVDPSMREQMKVFAEDSPEYRWITYVELY